METLRIGTCSWKFKSWAGLVYSAEKGINYLAEYTRHYDTVEVDQWFWSLFHGSPPVLPRPDTVIEYRDSVPVDFVFTVKVPNSITLTHYYKRQTKGTLVENPHFLSVPLLESFLERLEPLRKHLGPIMFQFEYLNKKKMPNMQIFTDKLADFFARAPRGYSYALEPRNPQIFTRRYFSFLTEHELSHVFIQGYYMPDITEVYARHGRQIEGRTVVRLHGYDRAGIEKKTGKKYNAIVESMDDELPRIAAMIQDLLDRRVDTYLNVNNHYEGSAPLTIGKIKRLIGRAE